MWQKIATEISTHNYENRWRDRNYKKYVEQKSSTVQERAYVEYICRRNGRRSIKSSSSLEAEFKISEIPSKSLIIDCFTRSE